MADEIPYTPPELRERELEYPYPNMKKVIVYVHKVYGCCPIAVEGDKLVFDVMLYLDESQISSDLPGYFEGRPQICSVAFKSFHPYVTAMCFGVNATDLGIAESGKDGYVMCPAWGPPTCEAAVIFRLHPEPIPKGFDDRFYEHLAKAGHVSVPEFYFERFASEETRNLRKNLVRKWIKAGRPKFWDGWRRLPCQPRRKKQGKN